MYQTKVLVIDTYWKCFEFSCDQNWPDKWSPDKWISTVIQIKLKIYVKLTRKYKCTNLIFCNFVNYLKLVNIKMKKSRVKIYLNIQCYHVNLKKNCPEWPLIVWKVLIFFYIIEIRLTFQIYQCFFYKIGYKIKIY